MHTTNVLIMEDKSSMKTEVKEERSSATSLGLCYCILPEMPLLCVYNLDSQHRHLPLCLSEGGLPVSIAKLQQISPEVPVAV